MVVNGLSAELHPNPVGEEVQVKLEGPGKPGYELDVLDVRGKVLREEKGLRKGEWMRISMANLPAGTYLLVFKAGNERVTKRLVKK